MSNPTAPITHPNAGTLTERLAKLNTDETISPNSSQPSTPSIGVGRSVVDNGTNLGSASGRKPSVGSQAVPFAMEKRTSAPSSRRGSRRGSGVFTTTSGGSAIYHTRTHVS
jgi:hexokinase